MTTADSRIEDIGTAATDGEASPLELVILRVRLRARRRAAWLAHLTAGGNDLRAASLEGRDAPDAEAEWFEGSEEARSLTARIETVEQALDSGGSRLIELARIFRLGPSEIDLLQLCVAAALDPSLTAAFPQLHVPPQACVTEPLAACLFGYARRSLWNPGSPAAVWRLILAGDAAAGEAAPVSADPVIVDWLQGEFSVDRALVGAARLVEPHPPLDSWPTDDAARIVEQALRSASRVRVVLTGPPSSGRRTLAGVVAERSALRVLAFDTGEIADESWADAFVRAQRLAVLNGVVPLWHGRRLDRAAPPYLAPAQIQFIAAEPGQSIGPCVGASDHHLPMPSTTIAERRQLWSVSGPETAAWDPAALDALAAKYQLTAGEIATVAQRAPADPAQAARFAREIARDRLGELAERLECPFTWDDLVVPDRLQDALRDFAFEARDRISFWEAPAARRLFPRGRGLIALLSGPPGTGKTMSVQIVAAALHLDLFRINLATVTSKYIGETAKHLHQIFARAARMDVVLLFDEADALFSKRTDVKDAHDRYANADTAYLLQLLEECRGIVVLATNRKQNIDPAFIRRVRYVFEFPRPDEAERQRIWRQVIQELNGAETVRRLDGPIDALAAHVDLSGAQIKNAVLGAIFVARRRGEPIALDHLVRAVDRELLKEGRALDSREREKLVQDA